MRLSHVHIHLERQLTFKEIMSNAYDNFTKDGLAGATLMRVNARLSTLKDDWEHFSLEHQAIMMAAAEFSEEEKSILNEHTYFTNNLFVTTHEIYADTVEKLNALLERDQRSIPSTSTSNSASLTTTGMSGYYQQSRLPRIDLPKFGGKPSDWLSFKDLFQSLVIDNRALSHVEKLQYLKTSLTGSAALLLKNTTVSADNFSKAWDALIAFYENQRELVQAALQSLFSLKRMTKESAAELERLYTNVLEIYRTLEILKRPVNYWDDIFVFIIVQRLDPESVKAWEQLLGSSKELPSWSQLTDFLISRLFSLKAYERTRSGHLSSQPGQSSAKSHYQSQSKESKLGASKSYPICSGNHYPATCSQYINKTVQQRLELIKKHRLCFNCLGVHRIALCKNTRRCQKCSAKHHTTIHQPSATKVQTTSTDKQSTAVNSKTTEAQVLHSSIEQMGYFPSVLLATALVKIITPSGSTSIARVLLDQGSEISLVTECLVQRLRLPRTHSELPLVGIGANKSTKTNGFTSITLTSHFNSDYKTTISAYILKRLTTSLPSVPAKTRSWKHLKGLEFADPQYAGIN